MKASTVFTSIAIPVTAFGLFAQDPGPVLLAQAPVTFTSSSGQPGAIKLYTEAFSMTTDTIAGAPYSADEKTESVQTLADGTRITNVTTSRVFRDSKGRVRREITLTSPDGTTPIHTMISIFDPVAGANFSLDPETKTASQSAPPGAMLAKLKAEMETRVKNGEVGDKLRTYSQTQTFTTTKDGGPVGAILAPMHTSAHIMAVAPPQREDLGVNTIEGVPAKGVRETTVIPVGAVGNDRPITITSERWYSPDLQTELKSVRNDPRMGQTTHTVSNINRTDPDASLFQVPADYTVEPMKNTTFRINGKVQE